MPYTCLNRIMFTKTSVKYQLWLMDIKHCTFHLLKSTTLYVWTSMNRLDLWPVTPSITQTQWTFTQIFLVKLYNGSEVMQSPQWLMQEPWGECGEMVDQRIVPTRLHYIRGDGQWNMSPCLTIRKRSQMRHVPDGLPVTAQVLANSSKHAGLDCNAQDRMNCKSSTGDKDQCGLMWSVVSSCVQTNDH